MAETKEEESLRFGTGILFVAFFTTLIAGLIAWMDNHNPTVGIELISVTIIIACLLIWSLYNPFYPFLCGSLIYIALIAALYSLSPDTFTGRKGSHAREWAVLGLGLLLNATWAGYKELKKLQRSEHHSQETE